MPRPERRLNPDADAVQKFACELRELRRKAGSPAYRLLARAAHYSPATLAEAAGGRRLPSLAVALAYARACGGDERQWEARWQAAAHPPEENDGPDAGIQHALARTAEEVYRALDPGQRQAARQLFLRLTAIGEGTEDTKRRIGIEELDYGRDIGIVLERLTNARLVIVDDKNIEMAHEALIQHWPRLGKWLAEDRGGRRIHRHLTHATASWKALDHDPGSLYRGARLTMARQWADSAPEMLASRERQFLDASIAAEKRERLGAAHRNRGLRWRAVTISLLLFIAAAVNGTLLLFVGLFLLSWWADSRKPA